jgi:hypothetical protein
LWGEKKKKNKKFEVMIGLSDGEIDENDGQK